MQRRRSSGMAALFYVADTCALLPLNKQSVGGSQSNRTIDVTLPNSYSKPLQMIDYDAGKDLFYNNDIIAHQTLPIPDTLKKKHSH